MKNHLPQQNFEKVQAGLKRKWQIALRRYVFEENPSTTYAPFFGLPASDLRNWIEMQFSEHMSWENFGERWNLSQRVPVALFDLSNDEDLELCWHFVNIVVTDLQETAFEAAKNQLSTLSFFELLQHSSHLSICTRMIDRLKQLQDPPPDQMQLLVGYLETHKQKLGELATLDAEDFLRLNKGEHLDDILMEKEIIKKYGS